MIHRKSTFFLGLFIFIIPFLGLPSSWRMMLITLSGLGLLLLSIKVNLPKKNTKGRTRREKSTPVFVENIPTYPRDSIVEMTKPNTDVAPQSDIK